MGLGFLSRDVVFTKDVVFTHSAFSGKWNAYFLLRQMQTLGGWHIGARVKKLEVKMS